MILFLCEHARVHKYDDDAILSLPHFDSMNSQSL